MGVAIASVTLSGFDANSLQSNSWAQLLRKFVIVILILMVLWRNDPPFPNEKDKTSSLLLFLQKMCLFVKLPNYSVFSSIQSLSRVQLFGTP